MLLLSSLRPNNYFWFSLLVMNFFKKIFLKLNGLIPYNDYEKAFFVQKVLETINTLDI